MSSINDLTGKRIGILSIISKEKSTKGRHARWLCKCDCGKMKIITGNNLIRKYYSCGCQLGRRSKSKKIIVPKGENHWNWKGGFPSSPDRRMCTNYKKWRKDVFERDNYTCVWCSAHGVYLEADHILEWAKYPELRFAIDNGRTLCKSCHKLRHSRDFKKKSLSLLPHSCA
jgi:hypothetical protein